MTLAVPDVIDPARTTLLDAAKVTWPDAELIEYINEGMWQLSSVKPEVYTDTLGFVMVAGVRQDLPADTNILLDVLYNAADGSPVAQVDRALLEVADPNWTAATASATIEHYMVDPRLPRQFWVYPPAITGSVVVLTVGKRPPGVATTGDDIPITDTYVPTLINYVLARAYQKNSKKQDLTKASYYMQQWAQTLGLRSQAQALNTPKIADGTPT
jgi:hypothetical protein